MLGGQHLRWVYRNGGGESLREVSLENLKKLKVIPVKKQGLKALIDTSHQKDPQRDILILENRIGRQRAHGFDPFLSPKEVAEYLGVSVRFVYERIFSGDLESLPMGRLRRIRLSTLENWLVRQQNGEMP